MLTDYVQDQIDQSTGELKHPPLLIVFSPEVASSRKQVLGIPQPEYNEIITALKDTHGEFGWFQGQAWIYISSLFLWKEFVLYQLPETKYVIYNFSINRINNARISHDVTKYYLNATRMADFQPSIPPDVFAYYLMSRARIMPFSEYLADYSPPKKWRWQCSI